MLTGLRRFLARGLAALALAATLGVPTAQASSTTRGFTPRYQVTGRVVSYLVGNQSLNCATATAGCTTAQNGTGNNNDFPMVQVDVDSDASTFNSSSAQLPFPLGATVLKAYLYWGADTSASGGTAAPSYAARNTVRVSALGSGYQTVTALQVDDSTGSRYTAVADVTALVTAAGGGTYTVANVQAGTGTDRYGGWSLVVVFKDTTAPLRSATLFDGSLNINTTAPNQISTSVNGFRTPATGVVGARIGLVAFEGDNNFNGDQFLVNGSQLGDALNPVTNVFNSTNTRLGVEQTGRSPQQSNMFGFDVDYIQVAEGVIANNATSANLTFTTTQETYFPVALLFVTNVYEPEIVTNFTKSVTDPNGGGFHPGDELEYTINVSNTGDDTSDATVVTDTLPVGVTYVPGSLQVTAGSNVGAKTDAAGDDEADYNAGTRTLTMRLGAGATATMGGSLPPVSVGGQTQTVKFRVTIDANQANGTGISNTAGISFTGATSGTAGTGATSPSTFTVTNQADVSITKTGPATVAAGAPISYVVTVANAAGGDKADGTKVTDTVPVGITGVTITCVASNGAVCPTTTGLTSLASLAIPTLPAGGSVAFTIAGTAPATAATLSNTASFTMPTGVADPTPAGNPTPAVVTTVQAGADLSMSKTLTTAGPFVNGQTVQYSIVVANAGPLAATNVVVSDTPTNLTITSVSGAGCTSLPCTIPSIANGANATLTVLATIDAAGAFDNSATVAANEADPNAGDNTDSTGNGGTATSAIVATNDSGSVVGNAGGTAVGNVLANDTLDGGPATTGTVTLSVVTPASNPNVALNTATGAVTVAAGTPAGTHTITYRICQASTPTNCATATVTVTVTAAAIAATNDASPTVNGASGGTAIPNVLANDNLGGAAPTTANATISVVTPASNAGVVLNTATGAVTVAAGTPAGTYTIGYRICEQLNAANCATATATVTVGAAAIAATNDVAPAVNGASGGTAIPNVLGNDTLNGAAATTANVTLSVVTAASNPNVSLNIATGAVTVAPGTPAGTYTIGYRICEQLNPANCATATASVTVAAQAIAATNDASPTVNGASGGTAIANVLANDALGGGAPTPSTVTISVVTPASNPNVALDTSTGAVTVAAGTPAGTYTIGYRICEQLNPTNCATATATVNVGAASIAAGNDSGTLGGATGGTAVANVLGNDTLNGAPATPSTVAISIVTPASNPNVVLNTSTGALTVAAGTPAGTYALTYRICEKLNPANCATATATATVTASPIAATDDAGTTGGATGGTAIANVLANDSLGGATPTLSNVLLTQTSTTQPKVTLDPATGRVNVAAGTPAGTYTVGYRICESLNPTNCAVATAVVTVTPAVLGATPDAGSVVGSTGGPAVPNVLANDTLDGSVPTLAQVSLVQVSTSNPAVTLDPSTGTVNVAPNTRAGTYTLTYRICERLNPANCTTATVTVTVTAAAIDAVDDTTPATNGVAGNPAVANVLGNDTVGGQPAAIALVTLAQVSTSNPAVTLDPATGNVAVAPNTPAGTYTVIYRICEQLNPGNCDTARVTVTVVAPSLVANDDTGATRQNTPVQLAVQRNDTMAGVAVGNTAVATTLLTAPTHGTATINVDGTITYTPATNYSGNDTFVYRLCDVVNPTVCDDATVTVTIAPNTVDAPNVTVNTPQTGPVVIDPMTTTTNGGGAPLDPTSVQVLNPPANGTVVVNPNGTLTYTPNTRFFGTETFTYRICDRSTPAPVCDVATVTIVVAMQAPKLRLTKTVPPRAVKVGDLVRYTVVIENTGISPASNATVVDVPPQGFTYVEGSLSLDDADDRFSLAGVDPIRVAGVDVPVGGRATLVYLLRVGAGVGHGTHTNSVSATDSTGNTVSNTATADVTVEGDPMLDDSLVLGTVFFDRNGDGVQQVGEPGLAGVRIASVEGLLIETDVDGRFHVAGIAAENALRGRNFILKVDAATLPPGSRFTTSNPLVRRITPGIPVRFDFGVSPPAGDDAAGTATR